MQLHTLKREHPNKKARQVGRGGTRGKTSGRGGKGQTARAGNKRRPQMRDILNIFEAGEIVNPSTLLAKNLVRRHGGTDPKVKILGNGMLSKKLSIEGCEFSKSAKEKIEKAGGSIK